MRCYAVVHVDARDGTQLVVVVLEQSMPRTAPTPKSLADKLADLLDRLIGGLAQPLRPAPAPVRVPVKRPAVPRSRGARF
jgi:hypothetical protein